MKRKLIPLLLPALMLLVACGGTTEPKPVPSVDPIHKATPTPVPPTPTTEVEIKDFSVCTLSGGEIVQEGWSGTDTGANWCNQCQCLTAGLACTKMACQSNKLPAPTPTEIPIKPISLYWDPL